MKKFLSIIIPCRNGEKFLHRCLDSVFPQLNNECEVYLVDDNSDDATLEVFKKYASENVCILHGNYGDPAIARNAAIEKAAGEYVWCVDSDDYIEPNAVEIIFSALKASRADILRFRHRTHNDGVINDIDSPFVPGIFLKKELDNIKHYAVGYSDAAPFFIWLHVFKRELLVQVPLLPLKTHLSECNSLAQRIFPRVKKIHIIDDILYNYVIRKDSISFHPIPYAYQALNRYRAVRDDLMAQGLYETYRYDLAFCVMDVLFLGLMKKRKCVFTTEYLLCNDIQVAHKHVRDILSNPDFKELLADAEKRNVPPSFRFCYTIMKNENEDGLYKLIQNVLR